MDHRLEEMDVLNLNSFGSQLIQSFVCRPDIFRIFGQRQWSLLSPVTVWINSNLDQFAFTSRTEA
ncbi:MAG: hypothetical protein OXE42_07535 [Gammaproteobacteria bacterium]|nr:hypothetical protein [Gammaproteobacteria bacterium]